MPKKKKTKAKIVKRYGIEVSSYLYCGALGAEHYYGEVWYDNGKKSETWKLERPLSTKEATYLNKKDDCDNVFFRWKRGDMTERFNSKKEVIDAGIKFLTDMFGSDIMIEDGDHCYSMEDNKVVYNG